MKALIVSTPGKLELRDIPAPRPGPHEALVRILACGVCATTDRELIKGRQPYHRDYPAVLGHEAIGQVVETGARVRNFKPGDLVTRPAAIWPGTSRDGLFSAWGGLAEYGIVRDRLAMSADGDPSLLNDYTALRQQVVPAGTALPHAVLAISLAETASWFRHIPSVAGKTVCVAGTGIAGLGIVLWSLLAGAARIIALGRRDERLQLARDIGAATGINIRTTPDVSARLRELNDGRGADFYFDAVGEPGQVQTGLTLLAEGGTLAIYGATEGQRYAALDLSAGPGHVAILRPPAEEHLAWHWVCALLKRGLIPAEKLLTHAWPLEDYAEAYGDGSGVVKGWIKITQD
ncbi:theronine dehydrogenase-like Zn-dependent dehydrogenase [Opitutaceae bacterium TAV1]|nr:theronine dehydrogenase-like Zn-dependent dehydrogenase [Opitutaceae bacterium TAV1]